MFVRAWKRLGGHEDVRGAGTAEVHFSDGRVVQITCAENEDARGDGMVLLRVWAPKQTAEYGGGNIEDLSLAVRVTEEETRIESVRYDHQINTWHRERAAEVERESAS